MRKIALIGGVGYIIIFITGIFANFGVLESLKDPESFDNTYNQLKEAKELFKLGLLAFLVMVIADLVLTWVLSRLFRQVNPGLNQITAWFRLVNVILFGVALYHLFDVLYLIGPGDQFAGLIQQELPFFIDRSLHSFNTTWLIGLVFFGVHLILLSRLICKSGQIHKSTSSLLFIAGIGYVLDSLLQFFYEDYGSISEISALVVVLPGLIGELALTGWLLFKGGK